MFKPFVRHHLIATCMSDKMVLYLNGEEVATTADGNGNFMEDVTTRFNCFIGVGTAVGFASSFVGSISLLNLYSHGGTNQVMSNSEARSKYRAAFPFLEWSWDFVNSHLTTGSILDSRSDLAAVMVGTTYQRTAQGIVFENGAGTFDSYIDFSSSLGTKKFGDFFTIILTGGKFPTLNSAADVPMFAMGNNNGGSSNRIEISSFTSGVGNSLKLEVDVTTNANDLDMNSGIADFRLDEPLQHIAVAYGAINNLLAYYAYHETTLYVNGAPTGATSTCGSGCQPTSVVSRSKVYAGQDLAGNFMTGTIESVRIFQVRPRLLKFLRYFALTPPTRPPLIYPLPSFSGRDEFRANFG